MKAPNKKSSHVMRLFLRGLLGSLGHLASTALGLLNALDDTDSDGLTHVTDGETTKRRVVSERLNAHRLGRDHLDNGSITRLDELRVVFDRLAGTAVDLLQQLGELASNVGGVAVKDRSIASTDLARVVQDNDLSVEGVGTRRRVVLGVTADVATANLLDGDVLHVEADVVTRLTLGDGGVVHFNGLDFGGDVVGSEGDNHTRSNDTSLDTADRDGTNTTNLVDILQGQAEGLDCMLEYAAER